MSASEAPVIRLADYRPSHFLIDTIDLTFRLDQTDTRVIAVLNIRANPAAAADQALVLDGDDLTLVTVLLDGRPLLPSAYEATPERFTLHAPPPRAFSLTFETAINPSANKRLMGLYRSGTTYCTQCEAEGFRRITYCLDRPDILSIYTTRIEADAAEAPLLLGNGNPGEHGFLPGGKRHFSVWHDPWPKPCYLFALVAGDLASVYRPFTTQSGRVVKLGIHVENGKEDRCAWAMDSLVRSMQWDERVFGLDYDLDVFNIVAVSDFNMGAMENKGLNIFNDKYVLADPLTATDLDYANIEAIIAHEYFHNWTGNRITCRDWFQLCLKEGLTVFRDQEFSADERSRPIKRIADVMRLRAAQFVEDSGPLAHPVRPTQYREINNFYTATVYEKGAEVIRMLKTLLGADDFARGMALYISRHDGQAVTMEDFIACFADTSGRDLASFFRWYEQAGTPVVAVEGHYDPATRRYTLTATQTTPATPGQPDKMPVVIPISLGLVAQTGEAVDVPQDVWVLTQHQQTIRFDHIAAAPVPSLLRNFSAPVRLMMSLSDDELLTLLRHDSDSFNRWQAGQDLAMRMMRRAVLDQNIDAMRPHAQRYGDAVATIIRHEGLNDPAYSAYLANLPSLADVMRDIGQDIDPDAIHTARSALRRVVAPALADALHHVALQFPAAESFSPDAASAGQRALRAAALAMRIAAGAPGATQDAEVLLAHADNLTLRDAALRAVMTEPGDTRERMFAAFEAQYRAEPLVLDKWFQIQAAIPERDTLARVKTLMRHEAFTLETPNRVYSLIMGFATGNMTEFHRPDGAGYRFIGDLVLEIDRMNPQVASRLATAFRTWRMMDSTRRSHAKDVLDSIHATPDLSRDVSDIIGRTRG
ncbi:MAG: aminopeptidase N [Beijerinckiaceae bacterium]